MRIEFNVTGAKRKEMAMALGELMDMPAEYQYMPTCAYKIMDFIVTKDGALEFEETLTEEQLGILMEFLASRGFTSENMPVPTQQPEEAEETTEAEENTAIEEIVETEGAEAPESTNEEAPENTDAADEDAPDGLTICFPIEKVNTENLQRLLDGKGSLIKKALRIDKLPMVVNEDKVSFPWFETIPALDELKAYTEFLSALCRKSRERKRITVKDHPVENEKYAFRCFLLGLGFIGKNFKEERKILLRNFSGSSAFKTAKEAGDEISE